MKKALATLFAATSLVSLSAMAHAQEATGDAWQYRLTPYIWVPSLSGDMAIGSAPSTSTNGSLLEVLDFAFLTTFEARKQKWLVLGEFNYLGLSRDSTSSRGVFSAETKLNGFMAGAALGYNLYDNGRGIVDAYGGFRVWSLDAETDFQRIPSVSVSKTWVDPLIGIKGSYDISDRFFVDGLADVGGFGVGSDLQWEIVGRAGYRISDGVDATIGYRHVSLDFDDDGLVLKTEISGPLIAVGFRF